MPQERRLGEYCLEPRALDVLHDDDSAGARHLCPSNEENTLLHVLREERAMLLDRLVHLMDRLEVVEVQDIDAGAPY